MCGHFQHTLYNTMYWLTWKCISTYTRQIIMVHKSKYSPSPFYSPAPLHLWYTHSYILSLHHRLVYIIRFRATCFQNWIGKPQRERNKTKNHFFKRINLFVFLAVDICKLSRSENSNSVINRPTSKVGLLKPMRK